MGRYISTKLFENYSVALRQHKASHSHCELLHGYALKFKVWFASNEPIEENQLDDNYKIANPYWGDQKSSINNITNLKEEGVNIIGDNKESINFKELIHINGCTFSITNTISHSINMISRKN